ncbi:hypothetical protein EUGRSUZ_H01450 [Eucalyptus grandis]|uniref:Uncharacterized protein n=2 Tax=Eucalyptus grandis TaxID=71139 RepID=A0ACC3JPB8_EUCGR|nr:hypothetical protein EUGRSUZ_H01450 [Eucalyptus grandis]
MINLTKKNSQPNETNWSSEERHSEEDNWIDIEEEESSIETDDDKERHFEQLPEAYCVAEGACRNLNWWKKLILGSSYR